MTELQLLLQLSGEFLAKVHLDVSSDELTDVARKILTLLRHMGAVQSDLRPTLATARVELEVVERFALNGTLIKDVHRAIGVLYRQLANAGVIIPGKALLSNVLWGASIEDRYVERVAVLERYVFGLMDVLSGERLVFDSQRIGAAHRDQQLLHIYHTIDELQHHDRFREEVVSELLSLVSLLSRGKTPKPNQRYEPIVVYLASDSIQRFATLSGQVFGLARAMGYVPVFAEPVAYGSIFRRVWSRLTGDEGETSVLENAAVAVIDTPRAKRDMVDAETEKTRAEAAKVRAETRDLVDAEADKIRAEADRMRAETRRIDAETKNVEADTMHKLSQTAQNLAQVLRDMPDGATIQLGGVVIAKPEDGVPTARVLGNERDEWEARGLQTKPQLADEFLRQLPPPKKDD